MIATALPAGHSWPTERPRPHRGCSLRARQSTRPTPSTRCSSSTTRRGTPMFSWRPAAGSPGLADVLARHAAERARRGRRDPCGAAGSAGPASTAAVRRSRREPAVEWCDGEWREERRSHPGARVVSRSGRRPRVRTGDGRRGAPGPRVPGRPTGDGTSRRTIQPPTRRGRAGAGSRRDGGRPASRCGDGGARRASRWCTA